MDNSAHNSSVGGHAPEFFQGDTLLGLQKIRSRLLDLTNKNRLLNFKHSPSAKNLLRVVDEMPDVLFQKLQDGKKLTFKPVPPPTEMKPLPLEEYLEHIDDYLGEASQTRVSLSQTSSRINVKEQAQRLGILTSFDLPDSKLVVTAEKTKFTDNQIQTLHYPEELEKTVYRIAGLARTAVEETGTNVLYLIFGFLEWYESADSSDSHLAPLITVPVTLQRDKLDARTGTYHYIIEYSGEDIQVNITLQEKLRQSFALQLPAFEEEDTPETYFDKLQQILKLKPLWKVRRQITLTLLSFGKLLMYLDLDPKNWPINGLVNNPRINDFFAGSPQEGGMVSEEYLIDAPEIAERVPDLIDDADSSQHSALVDALQGRNLVIEGPPGTGKSQTITNLIAAFLSEGKSVLFVAEKLTALEVVRRRLDQAHLGHFCLELHSHKTQKQALLADLARRLHLKGSFDNPSDFKFKKQAIEDKKQQLNAYVKTLNTAFGKLERTIHQILWEYERQRVEAKFRLSLVEPILIANAEQITQLELQNFQSAVKTYANHLAEIAQSHPDLTLHPWYGVRNADITYSEQPQIIQALQKWSELAALLDQDILRLNQKLGMQIQRESSAIPEIAAYRNLLPDAQADLLQDLIPKVASPMVQQRLLEFGSDLKAYHSLQQIVRAAFAAYPNLALPQLDSLLDSCRQGEAAGLSLYSIAQLEKLISHLEVAIQDILSAKDFLSTVERLIGFSLPITMEGVSAINHFIQALDETPDDCLSLRHPVLEHDGASTLIQGAQAEARALQERFAALSNKFHFNLMPPEELLLQHAKTCATAGFFRFLSQEFRAAKRDYLSMAKGREKPSPQQMADEFRELVDYFNDLKAFQNNPRFIQNLGPEFRGIDTPFEKLLQLTKWYESTRQTLTAASPTALQLRTALYAASRDQITALKALRKERRNEVATTMFLSNLCREVATSLPRPVALKSDQDLLLFASHLTECVRQIQEIIQPLKQTNIKVNTPLKEIPAALNDWAEGEKLLHQIKDNTEVIHALDRHFKGTETVFSPIAETINFVQSLDSAALPQEIKDWLRVEDVHTRLTDLRNDLMQLAMHHEEFVKAQEAFQEKAQLNQTEWWLSSIDNSPHPNFSALIARAHRALQARDEFPVWLDYLRARQDVIKLDLLALVQLGESRKLQPTELIIAFQLIFSQSLLKRILEIDPLLMNFSGLTHDQVRQEYAKLDRELMQLYRKHVAYKTDKKPVPLGTGGALAKDFTESKLIQKEITKKKKHIPIRQLVHRAGNALQALKPCFMMGPLSVAQYLAPGALQFDVVVMDEASQLKPEEALGAIARAKQVIVVGDPKQLPPTSFFDSLVGGEEDDEDNTTVLEEAESILDIASDIYQPIRQLRWHYRSRHESLIAFSNHEFYDDRLIVFPSPIPPDEKLGVKFRTVEGGVYANQQNKVEAQQVVQAILEHLRLHPEESLGVVTFNKKQKELIEDLLQHQGKTDPYVDAYLERYKLADASSLIKNLENVQGDEFDVVFISVTFGPDQQGNFYQRFGPINRDQGHRRLNVLFTRAKKRVEVFCSFDPDKIKVEPTSKWGVKALKSYLSYAQTGNLILPTITNREPDSDFEIAVAAAMRERGYEVVPQVGVAGYFIDLAVRHPLQEGSFILGLECDGATYHSSFSARDRDRLRQAALESFGWNIHRIWSTDWFKYPKKEIQKVVDRIQWIISKEA